MADPVTIAIIAGTIVTGVGQVQQGRAAEAAAKSEQDILNFNAREKEKEALAAQEAARERAEKFGKEARAFSGTQRAAVARAGVLATEGTPALLLEETAQELELERRKVLEEGLLQSRFLQTEAIGSRFAGESARARGAAAKRGSQFAAAGTLLTGFGSAATAKRRKARRDINPHGLPAGNTPIPN